jgi:hypothetical protein
MLPVRPSVEHPLYWSIQAGYLLLFLYAESEQMAADRAVEIVDQLPYELESDALRVREAETPEHRPELENVAASARQCGLGIFLVALSTGTDEGGWLDDF